MSKRYSPRPVVLMKRLHVLPTCTVYCHLHVTSIIKHAAIRSYSYRRNVIRFSYFVLEIYTRHSLQGLPAKYTHATHFSVCPRNIHTPLTSGFAREIYTRDSLQGLHAKYTHATHYRVGNVKVTRTTFSLLFIYLFLFIFWFYVPVHNCFSHDGTEPPLPRYKSLLLGVNVSCVRTQLGTLRGDRTLDPSIESRCTTRPSYSHLL